MYLATMKAWLTVSSFLKKRWAHLKTIFASNLDHRAACDVHAFGRVGLFRDFEFKQFHMGVQCRGSGQIQQPTQQQNTYRNNDNAKEKRKLGDNIAEEKAEEEAWIRHRDEMEQKRQKTKIDDKAEEVDAKVVAKVDPSLQPPPLAQASQLSKVISNLLNAKGLARVTLTCGASSV